MVALEENLAKMEADHIKKEQEWRNADNDRMKQFFNLRMGQQADAARQAKMVAQIKGQDQVSAPPVSSGRARIGDLVLAQERTAYDELAEKTINEMRTELAKLKDENAEKER